MRCMVIVKSTRDTEAGVLPSERVLNEMARFSDQLADAGILLGGEGLLPSSCGVRVRFGKHARQVVAGPFLSTEELIAGFWVWDVASMDEALQWAERIPNPDGQSFDVEIRPLFEVEDFGEALAADTRDLEERTRQRTHTTH